MSIKVTTNNNNDKDRSKPFPKLMINKHLGTIILSQGTYGKDKLHGIVLKDRSHAFIYESNNFMYNDFIDYNEPVTLQND